MNIQPQTMILDIDGQQHSLILNFNVLAELQTQCGELRGVMRTDSIMRNFTRIVAAMLNEEANIAGLDVRYTDKEIGRKLGWKGFLRYKERVFEMLLAAVADDDEDAAQPAKENEKNAQTSEAAATD